MKCSSITSFDLDCQTPSEQVTGEATKIAEDANLTYTKVYVSQQCWRWQGTGWQRGMIWLHDVILTCYGKCDVKNTGPEILGSRGCYLRGQEISEDFKCDVIER